MTVRDLGSNKRDPRYSTGYEYRPVDVFNDAGTSEIPASPDHSHQLFDNGVNLTPYLQDSWLMYDSAKPCKLYRAGNQIVIDGQVKNASVANGGELLGIFLIPTADPSFDLWEPAFDVTTFTGVSEDVLDTTFIQAQVIVDVSGVGIKIGIFNDFDYTFPISLDRVTISGFTYRTDTESTQELPPDSSNLFVWDGESYQGWDTGVWA